jgi:cobalt-zinc-cadmium efflux system membrane fusion protein
MQTVHRIVILIFAAIMLLTNVTVAQTIAMSAEQQQLLGIVIEQPVVSNQSAYLSLPAQVVVPLDQSFLVSAAQSGVISKVSVGQGASVVKGQALLSMSSPELLHLQRDYLQAISQRQLQLNQQTRLRSLWEDGVIAERRWLELNSAVHMAQSNLKQQHSLLLLAGMSGAQIKQLKTSRNLHQSLQVSAPNDGVILQRMIVPGQRVEAMTPLFHLANLSSLWLEIRVPVQRINHLKIDDVAKIQQLDVSAKVILLGRKVDSQSQTVLVRALISHPPPNLRVDQLVNVVFVRSTTQSGYQLPIAAVVRQRGQTYVFVQVDHGFEVRQISIENSTSEFVIVSSGLNGDEQIAVEGIAALKAAWQNAGDGD